MITREFGTTGVQVPVIGQGTWQMDSNGLEALRLGIDLGMTHIDTAELYTGAEEIVADAIRGRRQRVFLVSKVLPSNASYKGVMRACDGSLRRLKTDYLDVYLLHWWTGSRSLDEAMRAMEDLQTAGKIRGIGVSNFDTKLLQKSQKALSRERIVCNQILYNPATRGIEFRLAPYCQTQRIAVVGYSPFGGGNFPSNASRATAALADIGAKHGKTPRQVVLNFLTRDPNYFAIPKSSNPAHVRENAGAAGWTLDEEDLGAIDVAFPPPATDTPLEMA